jgi:cell division septation protein DedD
LVLENRQVVVIFLGLALLCGVFFSLGYVVGSNTAAPPATVVQPEENIPQASEKPSSLPSPSYMQRSPMASSQPRNETPDDTELNFYSSVQEDRPPGMLLPQNPGDEPTIAPDEELARIAVVPPPPGIVVQVSALTRREDAESLVTLLEERDLPVLVTTGVNDPLFHVIVGPYTNEAEAQKTKAILEQDGFRPFIRR